MTSGQRRRRQRTPFTLTMSAFVFSLIILATINSLIVNAEMVVTFQGISYPNAVAMDSAGNVFVSDNGNRVFKFAPDNTQIGLITDPLVSPFGLAVDAVDNLYVLDVNSSSASVIKFDQNGTLMQTFKVANFSLNGRDVAVDSLGNVFVAHWAGLVIKFFPDGTLANMFNVTGTGEFASVNSVAIEPVTDNIYAHVETRLTSTVRLFSPNGTLLNIISIPTYSLAKIAVDQYGSVYISSSYKQSILQFDSNGTLLTTTPITGIQAFHICIDLAGNIIVADMLNRRVLRYSLAGDVVGTFMTATPSLYSPSAITVDALSNVYVGDAYPSWLGGPRILKLNTNGSLLQTFACPSSSRGLAVDAEYNVYSAAGSNSILKFAPNGTLLEVWRTTSAVRGLALDNQQNLYTADWTNNRVIKFSPNGALLFNYTALPTLRQPTDVKVDSQANLYITDSGNNRVVKLNNAGEELASYYNTPAYASLNGLALDQQAGVFYLTESARVDQVLNNGSVRLFLTTSLPPIRTPAAVAVDLMHRLYVVDSNNNRIVRFSQISLPTQTPLPSSSSSSDLYLIIGVIIGGLVFVLVMTFIVYYLYHYLILHRAVASSEESEFVHFAAYNAASTHPAFL